MSRLTRQKGSLTYDDRLDVLSFAVAYFVEQMARDADQAVYDRRQDKIREDLEIFMGQNIGTKRKQNTWINI
jgi:hypothetical protein